MKLYLTAEVCVQMRMAAVGPGGEDHSCFLHSGVPGYLQHPHQDLVLGVRLGWHLDFRTYARRV